MVPSQICGCPFREPRVFEIAHIYIYVYVVICVYNHTRDCMVSDGDVPARLGPGFAPKISHDTHEITGFPYTLVTSHVLSLSQNWIIRVNSELKSSILISRIHR